MKDRGHLLYRQVYRALRGRILSGEYEPGGRIETEIALTRQFKASIITIRQAEQMLVDEGLLDKQQGRGTFVPSSVRRRLKILGVCGLALDQGLRHRMGPYFSDLLLFSQQEAEKREIEFETAWLPTFSEDRARRYCEENSIREYWGFVFFACGPRHLVLQRVRELGLRYALISAHGPTEEPRRVWLDYPQAIRLALDAFPGNGKPVLIMGLDNLRKEVEEALREKAVQARLELLPDEKNPETFENRGYHRMLELARSGLDLSRILFLDDVVAQGATRALLKAGVRESDTRIVLIGGKEEMMPLGYPATFVIHDTREEVSRAFDILERKPSPGEGDLSWRSGFRVVRNGAAPL